MRPMSQTLARASPPLARGFRSSPRAARQCRGAVLTRASIEGVQDLLRRDNKIATLSTETDFFEEKPVAPEGASSSSDQASSSEEQQDQAKALSTRSQRTADGRLVTRSREAIDAGMALFQQADYQAAVRMFELALELPGSGAMRRAGSFVEVACPSEGEENAALYNLACCYSRMGQAQAAMTCLESLLENGFEDVEAVRSDPDLAALRGPELDRLLAKYQGLGGVLTKVFKSLPFQS